MFLISRTINPLLSFCFFLQTFLYLTAKNVFTTNHIVRFEKSSARETRKKSSSSTHERAHTFLLWFPRGVQLVLVLGGISRWGLVVVVTQVRTLTYCSQCRLTVLMTCLVGFCWRRINWFHCADTGCVHSWNLTVSIKSLWQGVQCVLFIFLLFNLDSITASI